MHTRMRALLVALIGLLANAANVLAQTSPLATDARPADAVSQHSMEVGGIRLRYSAVAGTLPLFGPKGEVTANVFYAAYKREEAASNRPITFVFNGGPGAASAFLHLGAMGPRAVQFVANGAAAEQPVQIVDNPDTWLEFTDLVFVDPV